MFLGGMVKQDEDTGLRNWITKSDAETRYPSAAMNWQQPDKKAEKS